MSFGQEFKVIVPPTAEGVRQSAETAIIGRQLLNLVIEPVTPGTVTEDYQQCLDIRINQSSHGDHGEAIFSGYDQTQRYITVVAPVEADVPATATIELPSVD